MEKIDLSKIRGHWQQLGEVGSKHEHVAVAGGDDTIKSIEMVAEKVNEIVDFFNFLGQREPESATLLAEFNQMRSVKS